MQTKLQLHAFQDCSLERWGVCQRSVLSEDCSSHWWNIFSLCLQTHPSPIQTPQALARQPFPHLERIPSSSLHASSFLPLTTTRLFYSQVANSRSLGLESHRGKQFWLALGAPSSLNRLTIYISGQLELGLWQQPWSWQKRIFHDPRKGPTKIPKVFVLSVSALVLPIYIAVPILDANCGFACAS